MSSHIQPSRAEIRAEARSALSGRWARAIAVSAIPVLVSFILQEFGRFGGLLELLVAGPLALGSALFYLALARRREIAVGMIFDGFRYYGKALGLYLLMALFVFLWTLLLVIPGIIAAYRYSQAYYILADNPETGVLEALDRSKQLMTGHKWRLFVLQLSFLGWAILAVIPFGLGLLWLMPYVSASAAVFYRHLIEEPLLPATF